MMVEHISFKLEMIIAVISTSLAAATGPDAITLKVQLHCQLLFKTTEQKKGGTHKMFG